MKISKATEDYLKAIFELSQFEQRVSTNQIAERLMISPASVSAMIKKMAACVPPLLTYKKHHGVTLTPQGEKAALKVIRQHRIIELFLTQVLDYSRDEVHEEADHLEHAISDKIEERMAAMLGNPLYDPHGDPIPGKDLSLPKTSNQKLCEIEADNQAVIIRVRSREPGLLRYLDQLGLFPGVHISIVKHIPFDETMHVQIKGKETPIVLGPQITSKIFVELISKE